MSHEKYKYCIDRIYRKYKHIKMVENSKTEGFSEYLLDDVALQLRKMVEFLLLGLGIVHREAFVRAQNYFEFNCSGKGLFGILGKVDNAYFPISTTGKGKLNKQKLHNIFEVSSHILHITNPFLIKTQKNIDRKIVKMFGLADQMVQILDSHSVKLYNGEILAYNRPESSDKS